MFRAKKIFIYQRWGVGDCIMSTDAVKILKDFFNNSNVVFIVASDFTGRSLVELNLADDYRVISKESHFSFLRNLSKLDISNKDVLFLPVKTHPALLLMFKALFPGLLIMSRGLKKMIQDYSTCASKSRYQINANIANRYLSLKRERSHAHVKGGGSSGAFEKIVYHIGSGSQPVKRLPISIIKKVYLELTKAHDFSLQHYVLIGPDDSDDNLDALIKSCPGIIVFHSSTLFDLQTLLESAIVVTGDTGVSHIASYINAKVVVLGGPTNTIESAPVRGAQVLRDDSLCDFSPCYGTDLFRSCPFSVKCLSNLDHNNVVSAIKSYKTEAIL